MNASTIYLSLGGVQPLRSYELYACRIIMRQGSTLMLSLDPAIPHNMIGTYDDVREVVVMANLTTVVWPIFTYVGVLRNPAIHEIRSLDADVQIIGEGFLFASKQDFNDFIGGQFATKEEQYSLPAISGSVTTERVTGIEFINKMNGHEQMRILMQNAYGGPRWVFIYDVNAPHYDDVKQIVRPEEKITIWTAKFEYEGDWTKGLRIWQLAVDDRIIVDYEEAAEYYRIVDGLKTNDL